MEKLCERAKQYKMQLILAESDLDTNNSQEMKSDLLAVSFRSLFRTSKIIYLELLIDIIIYQLQINA